MNREPYPGRTYVTLDFHVDEKKEFNKLIEGLKYLYINRRPSVEDIVLMSLRGNKDRLTVYSEKH